MKIKTDFFRNELLFNSWLYVGRLHFYIGVGIDNNVSVGVGIDFRKDFSVYFSAIFFYLSVGFDFSNDYKSNFK